MIIECPECNTNNNIEFAKHVCCHQCKKSFEGHFFKRFKKPLLSAGSALLLGIIGTYKLDKHFIEEPRYPLEFEYELVDLCVNSSGRKFTHSWHRDKADICLCALKTTTATFEYRDINERESEFMKNFYANAKKC
jgi:hypothetical protein